MKKFILLIMVSYVYSYASLIGSNFSNGDIQILEDLDIKSSFITDYKLQEVYEEFQNRRNSYKYVENLNDASLFVPKVKDILRQANIPDVFIFMAMAESNFTIDARSSVKATGLWQFMNATGKKYGLRNDMYVDERMDLVKSTHAATKYLNSLYNRFGKWYLAAIAYNCGEGRVIEAITRATIDLYVEKNPHEKNSKKIRDFRKTIKSYQKRKVKFFMLGRIYKEVSTWNIKPDVEDLLKEQRGLERQYLPKESRRYIRKIISLAMMNSQNFIKAEENSHLLNIGISTTIASIPVRGGLHLKNVAKSIGMTYHDLLSLNKHIKQSIIPPYDKYYNINIPYSRLSRFNENKNDIKDTKFAIHIVRKGDTLLSISKKYKVPFKLIKDYNSLKSNRLSIKQKIVLPIPSSMIGKIKLAYNGSSKNITKKHTIKSGDSLYSIARKYKANVKQIMKDNKMKTTFLKIGDRLVIR
ncbi:MAG: LysM peptidoglycan-binding domain-containing protein [Arcobacter sp.]|nr:LysM peptidoglycan-binding domain-containing protein [Arcobacter sp.]